MPRRPATPPGRLLGLSIIQFVTTCAALAYAWHFIEDDTETTCFTILVALLPLCCGVQGMGLSTSAAASTDAVTAVGRALLGTVLGTGVVHTVAVLFGCPLFEDVQRTLLFSALVSTLSIPSPSVLFGSDSDGWVRLFAQSSPETLAETVVLIWSTSAIVGSWLGAFPIPLDWDRPWQRWPVSCVYGALVGHLVGSVAAVCFCVWTALASSRNYESKDD